MTCAICHVRKPRRHCPGVQGEICTICCGTEREVTVDCPLDCPYLQEARRHEPPGELDPESVPNRDIDVPEGFLHDREPLLAAAGHALLQAAGETGAVDQDVREALEALIRTHRTLESGLYYQTRPEHRTAGQIYEAIEAGLKEYRQAETERLGMSHTRDADVLRLLVLLQRVELTRANGRPKGRACLDSLRTAFGVDSLAAQARPVSSLILP
jgi:hypothetical protein